MLEQGTEQSGPAELDALLSLAVSGNDVLNAKDLRVGGVPIHCEAVTGTTTRDVQRDSTEAKHWEAFVSVVGFDDRAYPVESLLILVVWTEVVKRGFLCWQAV